MLRIQKCVLTSLLSSSTASPVPRSPLQRLLSAAAPRISPNPSFTVEDYLVGTCGLTRAQALKASLKLSHLKSPSKPDAVLAFLADLDLSGTNVAAIVAKDPLFLCASVDGTLGPIVTDLTGLDLSQTEIARFVSLAPGKFRCRSIVSNLPYCMSLFGSYENVLRVVSNKSSILGYSLEKVVKPRVALIREWGLGACDITKLFINVPWILGIKPKRLQVILACAEGLGVPRGSVMFRHALHAVAFLGEEEIADRVECLKNMFWWSDAEVGIAVSKLPMVLTKSMGLLQTRSEFLISGVGLEPAYIAHRPALLSYSLEGRLRPRYYVLKFLKENVLLDRSRCYYSAVALTEKVFMEKYISPHSEAAPHLAEDYATACKGEVRRQFMFAKQE